LQIIEHMRVSTLAMGAVLCAFASAKSALRGRSLDDTATFMGSVDDFRDKDDTRSEAFTDTFNVSEDSHGPQEEFEGGYQLGLILGFIVTGVAMLFAVVVILNDECKRHTKFQKMVEDDIHQLKAKHGCSQADIDRYMTEFEDKEKLRGVKVDAEEERKKLAEIN